MSSSLYRLARGLRLAALPLAGILTLALAPTAGAATASDPPTALAATATGTGAVSLTWTAPVNDGGSPVTAYAIWAWSAAANSGIMSESTTTSASFSGLTAGTYYIFTITAFNTLGWSAWAAWSNWVLVKGAPPSGLVTFPEPGLAPATCSVVAPMRLAADYWMANGGANPGTADWHFGLFNEGTLALYDLTQDPKYLAYVRNWAGVNHYADPTSSNVDFGDVQSAGQAYEQLYEIDHNASDIANISSQVSAETGRIQAGNQTTLTEWWYVDATEFSMPNFEWLAINQNHPEYIPAAQTMWNYTENVARNGTGLRDKTNGLFWRDNTFAGTTIKWARGNGWIMMNMTKDVAMLPAGDPRRAHYISVIQQMAGTLKSIQRPDGFWNVDMGNPNDFPGPEETGTAWMTYGLAYGIAGGYLDSATYLPVVQKSWHALTTMAEQSNGFVGYVQNTADQPSAHQPVTASNTAGFGVGGFLLAGGAMSRVTGGC